ncbi:MAG: hypothetical protein ABIN97_04950 [Ginsengibacter sp.]
MNYFELFEMPVSLQIDRNELYQKYLELQKKYNNGVSSKSSKQLQEEMFEMLSLIQTGFEIFQNADDTIRYVLMIKGLLEENENYALHADFLVEMRDLIEILSGHPDILSIEEAATKVSQIETQLYQSIQNIIENYNEERTTNEQLLYIKDYYYKKRYINNILEKVENLRNNQQV